MAVPAASAARPVATTAPARRARPRVQPAPSRPARARAVARPQRRPARTPMPARLVPLAVGRTAGAVSGLAESGLVHRLTRGRMWIGLLTTLLVGIVALNVFTLSVNATSSRTTRQTDVLQRQNSALQGQIAAAGASSDRVQTLAGKLGMIVPELGSIGYVEAGPKDAALAAQRLESGAITAGA